MSLVTNTSLDKSFAAMVEARIVKRDRFSRAQDWAAVEAIEAELGTYGVKLEDHAQGVSWRRETTV